GEGAGVVMVEAGELVLVLYGRLPCGKRVPEVLTRRNDGGLISGLVVQSGHKPPLLASMVSRWAGADLQWRASLSLALTTIQIFPARGPTASPSLHRLDSRTLCGIHSCRFG